MLDVGRLLGLRSYKPQVVLIAILPAPNGNQELRREEAAGRRTLGVPAVRYRSRCAKRLRTLRPPLIESATVMEAVYVGSASGSDLRL
jgi:hypothetical protein